MHAITKCDHEAFWYAPYGPLPKLGAPHATFCSASIDLIHHLDIQGVICVELLTLEHS